MRFPEILSRFGRWLYVSQPARLLSARARSNYHLSIADKARDCGDWAKAAAHYNICLTDLTHRHDLWVQLGNMRKELGDLAGSRAAYEAALALAAGDSDLALQLGHLTKIQGCVEEARQWYRKALELDAHNQSTLEELTVLGEELHAITALLSSGDNISAPNVSRAPRRMGLSSTCCVKSRAIVTP